MVRKKLFDTSALIAGLVKSHPLYTWSALRFAQVHEGDVQGFICTHGLAELFSGLTTNPQTRYKPAIAEAIIERLLEKFKVVDLGSDDYLAAFARAKNLHLSGGAVYDILHAQAFLKAGADSLVTLNAKHFLRLGDDIASRVESPLERS